MNTYDEEVEGTATAEDLSSGPVLGGDVGAGLGEEAPVVASSEIGTKETGDVDNVLVEGAVTGLDDGYIGTGIFGETGSDGETGGTTSDDDVVKLLLGRAPGDVEAKAGDDALLYGGHWVCSCCGEGVGEACGESGETKGGAHGC